MSNLKSLQLLMPLCGALLLAAPLARAQDAADDAATAPATSDYPAPAASPEIAGERFYQFLAAGVSTNAQSQGVSFNWAPTMIYADAFSREQWLTMMRSPEIGRVEQLFAVMAQQKDEPQYEGVIVGTEGDQTFVEVSPVPARKRSVVVIAEDGGFRVDLRATYGRWNDLSGEKLDLAWFDATGIFAPALEKNATFIENKARSSCQSNLKQAMLGVLQFSIDHQETYPPANKWIDEMKPYLRTDKVFDCPSLPDGSKYGYAFNQKLSSISMSKLDNVAQTVAIYETDDLTRNAFGAGQERAYRHGGGSNIAFADGHVKWFAKGSESELEVSFNLGE